MTVAETDSSLQKILQSESIGVYGYGRTGKAVVDTLQNYIGAQQLWVMDDAEEKRKQIDSEAIQVFTEKQQLGQLDRLIVSPGVPADHPFLRRARSRGIPVWGEIELAYRLIQEGTFWAVTGTNGKSTCVELAGKFLEARGKSPFVGGNRGRPLIEAVSDPYDYSDYVVEVSSFQVEGLKQFRPDHALLTNLGDDHVDRHGSIEAYHQLKWDLLTRLESGRMVYPEQQIPPDCHADLKIGFNDANSYGLSYPLKWSRDGLVVGSSVIKKETIPLQLQMFPENLLSVISLVFPGPDSSTVRRGIDQFEPLPYRAETVPDTGSIDVINDSKATNPHAVSRIVNQVNQPFRLVLGGAGKQSDYSGLFDLLSRKPPEELVITGGKSLRESMTRHSEKNNLNYRIESDWRKAVQSLVKRANDREAVLLSPGATSFDAFKNYQERGRKFNEWVREAVVS